MVNSPYLYISFSKECNAPHDDLLSVHTLLLFPSTAPDLSVLRSRLDFLPLYHYVPRGAHWHALQPPKYPTSECPYWL
jgi:hypothetical protein